MPDLQQLVLPSGKVIRVCSECSGCEEYPPRHAYYCSAVREYSRSDVLREMVRVDDDVTRLEAEIAEAGGDAAIERDMLVVYGPDYYRGKRGTGKRTPLLQLASDHFLQRNAFWEWAWWIGLDDYWSSTTEQRDDITAEVAEMRARLVQQRTTDQVNHVNQEGAAA